jgi:hypothetical protein
VEHILLLVVDIATPQVVIAQQYPAEEATMQPDHIQQLVGGIITLQSLAVLIQQ